MHTPNKAQGAYEQQQAWLKSELEESKKSGLPHVVVFQHHPLFLKDPQEPDQYENIPRERRMELLDLFARYGVRKIFAGHTHRNVIARAGDLEIIATAPVGKPLAKDGSGIRVATVTGSEILHRYYEFGMMPERLAARTVVAAAAVGGSVAGRPNQ
jgi:3',5'-cyclic AMP phosphodiesterase CpdA